MRTASHCMSWRVAILPFMEHNDLYRQYDPKQSWDSPKNLALRQTNAARISLSQR